MIKENNRKTLSVKGRHHLEGLVKHDYSRAQ